MPSLRDLIPLFGAYGTTQGVPFPWVAKAKAGSSTPLGMQGYCSGAAASCRSLLGRLPWLEGLGGGIGGRWDGGCAGGLLWRRLPGGFGALALLIAAIVELLVGGLFLHDSIMSQIGGTGAFSLPCCVVAVPRRMRPGLRDSVVLLISCCGTLLVYSASRYSLVVQPLF